MDVFQIDCKYKKNEAVTLQQSSSHLLPAALLAPRLVKQPHPKRTRNELETSILFADDTSFYVKRTQPQGQRAASQGVEQRVNREISVFLQDEGRGWDEYKKSGLMIVRSMAILIPVVPDRNVQGRFRVEIETFGTPINMIIVLKNYSNNIEWRQRSAILFFNHLTVRRLDELWPPITSQSTRARHEKLFPVDSCPLFVIMSLMGGTIHPSRSKSHDDQSILFQTNLPANQRSYPQ